MILTFSKQSSSLMLPPVHPPAVTSMALNFRCSFLTDSITVPLFSRGLTFFCRSIFWKADWCGLKSTLKTWYLERAETTCWPSCPEPPMQRIFFINIIITMLLDNEFLSPEQHTRLHLKQLIADQPVPHRQQALRCADNSLSSVITLIQTGMCFISPNSKTIEELMDKSQKAQSELQREEKRRKREQKALKNSLLYSKNKNKQIKTQQTQPYGVLSHTQHLKFINQMKQQSSLRKLKRQKQKQLQQHQLEAQLSTERELSEASRLLQLQRRKEAIKDSLKKMRENHEFFLQQEQQSRTIFNKIKRKKRLYEQMKQSYQQIAFELISQREEKAKKERKELNKLDLSEIKLHEKEYEEWKKKQVEEAERHKEAAKPFADMPPLYQPPAHSQKIAHFLNQQIKNKNKVQISKKIATQKLHRIAEYTSVVREKFKPKSPPAKTQSTQKEKSFGSNTQNKKSHTQLGNEYLRQAKLIIRKRSKTEERSLNPQKIDTSRSKREKDKSRTATLNYIPQTKRKEYIERMKREEIEKILKGGCLDEAERLRKLKLADQRLSRELKKKQNEMRIRYTTENSESTLALLLGTIRAKMSLIDCYRTKS